MKRLIKCPWPLLLCCFCWLCILLVPPLRQMFLTQMRGDGFYRGWAYGPIPLVENDFDAQKLNVENVTDVRVLAVHAAAQPNAIRALDAVIEKHPQEAWLLAGRLRISVSKMRHDRTGGELSDPYYFDNQAAKIPSPERTEEKPNFTPTELQKTIALARRGQKLESNNAFFDWMLVYFLMAGWSDEEAFCLLKSGSHKPHFNEHQAEWLLAQRAANEDYYQVPQAPEAILDLDWPYLPDSAGWQRSMAKIMTWQGIKAQRRGDHQKALQIFSDSARLNYTATREAPFLSDELSYLAMADISLMSAGKRDFIARRRINDNDKASYEKRARLTAKQVQTYATAHAQAALGREIAALALQAGQRRDKIRHAFPMQTTFFGMDRRPLIWSISLYWVAALLLLLMPMLFFWWLIIGGALRLADVPKIEPETTDVRCGVLTVIIGTSLLWTLALFLGTGWGWLLWDVFRQFRFMIVIGSYCLIIGFLWPVPLSSWVIKRRARKREYLAQGVVLQGVRNRVREVWGRFRLSSFLSINSLYILAGTMAFWWMCALGRDNPDWPYVFHLTDSSSPLIDWLSQSANIFPVWPQLFFASALAFLWLRELFAPDKSRAAYQLRTWHAVLGHLIVVAGVSYVFLLAVLLPFRARSEVAVNEYIERGEVASMLQNLTS